jgi:hypothetical protein
MSYHGLGLITAVLVREETRASGSRPPAGELSHWLNSSGVCTARRPIGTVVMDSSQWLESCVSTSGPATGIIRAPWWPTPTVNP